MPAEPTSLSFKIDLGPGQSLSLPPEVVAGVGPGHWLVTIQPLDEADAAKPVRDHRAFLNSYAPEDEGLYDDCAAG
jgi:hypothetical protein